MAETCWEEPSEGFVSLLDQQLEELVSIFAMTFVSIFYFVIYIKPLLFIEYRRRKRKLK